jgi:ABC-type glycerol-3-phosphate transport system permease component
MRKLRIGLDGAQFAILLVLTLVSVFMLLPLVYVVNQAFKPLHELLLFPPTFIVRQPTLQNFVDLLAVTETTFVPATRYLLNSIIVTLLATAGMVVTGSLCAYPLSKHRVPGSKLFFGAIMLSLLFVEEVVAIPRFVIVQSLGIMNTYWGHVLPMIALPVGVFLLKQFMDQVPQELVEAAKIDGATEIGIFARVMLPLVAPAMATITIIAFQTAWGNMETSALFMQEDSMKTLAFFLSTLTPNLSNSVVRQGAAAAGALLLFLPSLIVFLLYQRKFIATMAHSGIK